MLAPCLGDWHLPEEVVKEVHDLQGTPHGRAGQHNSHITSKECISGTQVRHALYSIFPCWSSEQPGLALLHLPTTGGTTDHKDRQVSPVFALQTKQ
jgi:hypothetical protein